MFVTFFNFILKSNKIKTRKNVSWGKILNQIFWYNLFNNTLSNK